MKEVLHRGFCAHFAKNPVTIKQDDLAELLFLVLVLNHGANEVKFVRTFFVFLFELSSKYMEGDDVYDFHKSLRFWRYKKRHLMASNLLIKKIKISCSFSSV